MSFTVKLATFLPWKAPVPIEAVGTYPSHAEASAAGMHALSPIAERELAAFTIGLNPVQRDTDQDTLTAIELPDQTVHGYVIYDANGVEVGNWTTLDIAVGQAAKG